VSNEPGRSHGVMEGKGAYNKYARLPADGAASALPLLKNATREVELDPGDEPIVIADYGSSQGKNSLAPIRAAVEGLKKRVGPNRAISVFHIDQPSNDFTSLFELLDTDPERYAADQPNVYPAAIGRSFYEQVLPPGSVHLGWSSYAAVWLSRTPTFLMSHFLAARCSGAARAAFDRQAAQDWEAFLSLRAKELRPGGRLIVVLPGIADDGSLGIEPIFDHAMTVLEEMVADGAIASEERLRMVLRAYPRRKGDLLAPFESNRNFQGLLLEGFQMSEVSGTAWVEYECDRDKEALAAKRALFFRSVFVPSLACALSRTRAGGGGARDDFADQLEQRLKRHLATEPEEMPTLVQTILFAKRRQS